MGRSASRLRGPDITMSEWLRSKNKSNSDKGRLIQAALLMDDPEKYVREAAIDATECGGEEYKKAANRLLWEFNRDKGLSEDTRPREPTVLPQSDPLAFYPNLLRFIGLPV